MLRIGTRLLRNISHSNAQWCKRYFSVFRFDLNKSDGRQIQHSSWLVMFWFVCLKCFLISATSSLKSGPVNNHQAPHCSSIASASVFDEKTNSKYSRFDKNRNFTELLETLPSNPKRVNRERLVKFFEITNGKYLIRAGDLEHPKFNVLRMATENLAQQLNARELKDILIALLPSKAVMHKRLTQVVVHRLLDRVTDFPFYHILFIDHLIHRYYKISELSKDSIETSINVFVKDFDRIGWIYHIWEHHENC